MSGEIVSGAELIKRERERQVVSGWTEKHDDEYRHGELAKSAAELAVDGTDAYMFDQGDADSWGLVQKHRGDRIRQLTIAGALIAAEIDRIMRRNKEGETK